MIGDTYARLNKTQQALDWLEQTADTGFPCYPLFERDPNLDSLRKDPRFSAFLERMKKQWERHKAMQ